VSHLLSVLILYQIGLAVVSKKTNKSTLSFIAAALHIISPAGIFLVAPYTEAPFAFLNFLGQLLYVHSWNSEYGLVQDMALATSGICFGLSATIRGNGLLSGIILFADVVIWAAVKVERALQIRVLNVGRLNPSLQAQMRVIKGRRIPATIIAGLFVGLGFVIPQYVAYQDFCNSSLDEVRPWCHRLPPSIYSWVQNHYWSERTQMNVA
jgi:phosphatidylinositol glycan class V